jgi:tetratricopeptide (TPR) repeat protein
MLKTRTANLLDIVELVEDLPEYDVKRGEQGVVVDVFDDPEEGYILEFGDPSGTSSKLAYWVKPEQIKWVTPTKAQELEVVELVEDLPQYSVKKGERAVVISAFTEPDEAYDLEFVDESGAESRFAYSVRPSQIRTADEAARESFERGIAAFANGNTSEAEREFQRATELKPSYLGVLHNSIVNSFKGTSEWQRLMTGLRLVLRLDPNYVVAQQNLATAYLNFGIEKADEGNLSLALQILYRALAVATTIDTILSVRESLAAVYTSLGLEAHRNSDFESAVRYMSWARQNDPNETTRHNLGMGYAHFAYSCFDKGEYHSAKESFESAEDSGVLRPELLHSYGVTLVMLGQLDEAIRAFERALELSPENESTRKNLDLAKKHAESGFAIDKIVLGFDHVQLAQPVEYQIAA